MSSPKRIQATETDWQKIPTEILAAIAKHLTSIIDYVSFRAVCRCWRSAATFYNFDRAFPRVPWLMYIHKEEERKAVDGDDVVQSVTNFFDMESYTSKISNFPPPVGVPYLSWSGWIVYVSKDSVDVSLTHPIWRIQIELPGLDTFPACQRRDSQDDKPNVVIRKLVLSGSPTLKIDLMIMVIWGDKKQLGFCQPVDKSWTVMASWDASFRDIVYHNGRLYALDSSLRVVECHAHGPSPTQIRQVFVLPDIDDNVLVSRIVTHYLVESSGKFRIVCRQLVYTTLLFRLFEVDLMDGSYNEIHDLGSRALFLGCNSSLCLELSANWSNIKPNSIYFTNDIERCKDSDIGAYKLSDMSIKGLPGGFSGVISPLSTWVMPSF